MNKFIFIVLASLFSVTISAQSVDKGRVQFKAGFGPYFGKITSSHIFTGGAASLNGGEDSFFALQNELSIHYNTHKNFSIGLFLSSTNQGDTDTTSYRTGSLGFSIQYYIINKPKLNFYFDARVGGLGYNETSSNIVDSKIYINGEGSINAFSLGVNKYFGNVFGLYLKGGFMRQAFALTQYRLDSEPVNSINLNQIEDIKTMFNGGFVNFGLTIKLRNKSPKSE
jgi:hypothetical protein